MQKLNILFPESHSRAIKVLSDECMNSRSEIARAAMSIGLKTIQVAKKSMTDRELYEYITGTQTTYIEKTGVKENESTD